MDQPTKLENFENSRVRIWFCQNTLIAKFGLLWGRILIMGKGGIFGTWSISLLDYLSLCPNKWVWLRDRKMNLICKKQTKWWQRAIQICQFIVKNNLVFNCIDIAFLLVAFGCVGINHQKGGDWKGNVPLGHFCNVLVIKCPTHIL